MSILKRWRGLVAAIVCIALVLCIAPSVRGAIVQPGQSVTAQGDNPDAFPPPQGTQIASKTQPVTLFTDISPNHLDTGETGVIPVLDLALTSEVLRDDQTGNLTFFYHFDRTDPEQDGTFLEDTTFVINGFDSFLTDVRGKTELSLNPTVSRSSDGDRLTFNQSTGLGGTPSLIVVTDAKNFDARGTGSLDMAADAFSVISPEGDRTTIRPIGSAAFSGAFVPAAGGPQAIPLPGAAWAALLVVPILWKATRSSSKSAT